MQGVNFKEDPCGDMSVQDGQDSHVVSKTEWSQLHSWASSAWLN